MAKQGLTLAEVKTKNCLDTLENLIGVKEDVIEDLFDKIDVNGDGIAHRHEMIIKSGGGGLNLSPELARKSGL